MRFVPSFNVLFQLKAASLLQCTKNVHLEGKTQKPLASNFNLKVLKELSKQ